MNKLQTSEIIESYMVKALNALYFQRAMIFAFGKSDYCGLHESFLDASAGWSTLENIKKKWPSKYQEVYREYVENNLSIDVISEKLGICPEQVENLLTTVRNKIIVSNKLNKYINKCHYTETVPLEQANVGDYIYFGKITSYKYMDNKWEDPIRWIVLKEDESGYLLLAERVFTGLRFSEKNDDWSMSEIRQWLNNDFYEEAFTKEEKNRIVETTNSNSLNVSKYVCDCYSCVDKVFILSAEELEKYVQKEDLKAPCTYGTECVSKYKTGPFYDSYNGRSSYHTRTMVKTNFRNVRVSSNGNILYGGEMKRFMDGIRPAIVIRKSQDNKV